MNGIFSCSTPFFLREISEQFSMNPEKSLQLQGKFVVCSGIVGETLIGILPIFTNAPYVRNRLFTENNRIFIFK